VKRAEYAVHPTKLRKVTGKQKHKVIHSPESTNPNNS